MHKQATINAVPPKAGRIWRRIALSQRRGYRTRTVTRPNAPTFRSVQMVVGTTTTAHVRRRAACTILAFHTGQDLKGSCSTCEARMQDGFATCVDSCPEAKEALQPQRTYSAREAFISSNRADMRLTSASRRSLSR